MKKISFLVVFVITLFKVCYAQTSQWDVYNSIPSFKKIEIIFNKNDSYSEERIENFFDNGFHKHNTTPPRLFINDDYTGTMAYVIPLVPDWSHYTSQNLAISGNGVLLWQNDHMVLHLHITEKLRDVLFHTKHKFMRVKIFSVLTFIIQAILILKYQVMKKLIITIMMYIMMNKMII